MRVLDLNAPEAWVPIGAPTEHLEIYAADAAAVKSARDYAARCADDLAGGGEVSYRVQTVVSELATNATRHGVFPGRPACFAVQCRRRGAVFLVDVIDRRPYKLPTIRRPGDRLDKGVIPEGGMGLYLARELATDLFWFRNSVGAMGVEFVKVVRAAFL